METRLEILNDAYEAQGPDGLRDVLNKMLEKSMQDASFRAEPHYVHYQLGAQESFLKIDMSAEPYLFWYCDLDGRPATNAVRNTIANFLLEKFGETEKYIPDLAFDMDDVDGTNKAARQKAAIQDFLTKEDRKFNLINSKRSVGVKWVERQTPKVEQAPPPPIAELKEKSFAQSMFGLFNEITKKTAKKSEEFKPKGPGNKIG